MTEKIESEKLAGFLKTIKNIYAARSAMRTMAEDGILRGIKGVYYGSEAVSAGICAVLDERDILVNNRDGLGNLVARGCDLKYIFAEMLGRSGGYNSGFRGFLNITVPEKGIYSANSFSDTQVAIGTGFALSAKLKGENNIVAAFYDGSNSNEGIIHESMNIAAAFCLPVLFVCLTRVDERNMEKDAINSLVKKGRFSKRSIGYNIEGHSVDGMDAVSIYSLAGKLTKNIRKDGHPAIIECFTVSGFENFLQYKSTESKYAKNASAGPGSIISMTTGNLEKELLERQFITLEGIKDYDEAAVKVASEALEYAKSSPFPAKESLDDYIYAESSNNIQTAGGSL